MSAETEIWDWVGDQTGGQANGGSVLDRVGVGAEYGCGLGNRGKPDDVAICATECGYCGSHVSSEYVRVCGVGGEVDVCPNCRADQPTTTGGRRL